MRVRESSSPTSPPAVLQELIYPQNALQGPKSAAVEASSHALDGKPVRPIFLRHRVRIDVADKKRPCFVVSATEKRLEELAIKSSGGRVLTRAQGRHGEEADRG